MLSERGQWKSVHSCTSTRGALKQMADAEPAVVAESRTGGPPPIPSTPITPLRLAHAGLRVRDLQRSVTFYQEVLGLQVSDEEPAIGAVFMRLHATSRAVDHHTVVFFRCDPGERAEHGPALDHLAFELDSLERLYAAAAFLRNRGIAITGVRGGAGGHSRLYFRDPDGHRVELFHKMAVIGPDGVIPPIPDESALDFDAPPVLGN